MGRRNVIAALLLALALLSPAQARTTYFLYITTAAPVALEDLTVEAWGVRQYTLGQSSPYLVYVAWQTPGDRACYDVIVTGPRLVGRSTDLTACPGRASLPLVVGP